MIELTKRQEMLLSVTCKILDILNEYCISDKEVERLLKYDNAEQDIGCLSDDLKSEFGIED